MQASDLDLWPEHVDVIWEDNPGDGQANMDFDTTIAEEVAALHRPPTVRIWRAGPPGIGVSRKDVAKAEGEAAADALRREGWSVVIRGTGGTAVPQGPGVVHVSYLFPRRSVGTTDAYYRLLTEPLIRWLHRFSLQSRTGELPGSYCDGTYNILVGGQKLVGTAQAWRGGLAGIQSARPGYIVAHACLAGAVDLDESTALINRFYAASGNLYTVERSTATTLQTLLPERLSGMTDSEVGSWMIGELLSFFRSWHPAFV